jgi:hypothetical protein
MAKLHSNTTPTKTTNSRENVSSAPSHNRAWRGCVVCGHRPAPYSLIGIHFCRNHYDAVIERQRQGGSVAAIVRQLRKEWVTFVMSGLVEGWRDEP